MNIIIIVLIISIILFVGLLIFNIVRKNSKKKDVSELKSDATGSVKLPNDLVAPSGLYVLFTSQNNADLVINSGNIPNDIGPTIWSAKTTGNYNLGQAQAPFFTELDADASGDLILYGTGSDNKPLAIWKASTSGLFFKKQNQGGPYDLTIVDNHINIYDKGGNLIWSTEPASQKTLVSMQNLNEQLENQQKENRILIERLVNFGPKLQSEVKYPCSMLPNRLPLQSPTKGVYNIPNKTYDCPMNTMLQKLEQQVDFQPPLF